jgi:hypothetical protein
VKSIDTLAENPTGGKGFRHLCKNGTFRRGQTRPAGMDHPYPWVGAFSGGE